MAHLCEAVLLCERATRISRLLHVVIFVVIEYDLK
jgi:hypothetical protein